jgi:pyruvate,orthophosphate dikinase
MPCVSCVKKVMGVSHTLFEHELETMKAARGVDHDTDLTTEDLKELVEKYKGVYQKALGEDFPTGNLFKF